MRSAKMLRHMEIYEVLKKFGAVQGYQNLMIIKFLEAFVGIGLIVILIRCMPLFEEVC